MVGGAGGRFGRGVRLVDGCGGDVYAVLKGRAGELVGAVSGFGGWVVGWRGEMRTIEID